MNFESLLDTINGRHKFKWSKPINSYTLASMCEYCGEVAFHSNFSGHFQEHIKSPCRRNRVQSVEELEYKEALKDWILNKISTEEYFRTAKRLKSKILYKLAGIPK